MPQTIKLKRSATPGQAPTTAQLDLGEVAINTNDGRVYFKKDDGTAAVFELNTRQNPGVFDDYMEFNANSAIKVPVGSTAQRPTGAQLTPGIFRYNTSSGEYEGYDGSAWGTLNGLKDADEDTYVLAGTSSNPGLSDSGTDDVLTFVADGTTVGTWSDTRFVVETATRFDGSVEFGPGVTLSLPNDAVGSNMITDGSVTTAKIADVAVTTAKIADDAVTEGKLSITGSPTTGTAGLFLVSDGSGGFSWSTASLGSSFSFDGNTFTDARKFTIKNNAGAIVNGFWVLDTDTTVAN